MSLAHLSHTQVQALMIADNRLTENSTWDQTLLAEQFRSLTEVDLDFAVEVSVAIFSIRYLVLCFLHPE